MTHNLWVRRLLCNDYVIMTYKIYYVINRHYVIFNAIFKKKEKEEWIKWWFWKKNIYMYQDQSSMEHQFLLDLHNFSSRHDKDLKWTSIFCWSVLPYKCRLFIFDFILWFQSGQGMKFYSKVYAGDHFTWLS